ncbi:hypothetical protein KW785_02665 [Candidatus Parcubacteria bacterium]|nr:hypothetical protein [Candidatus Parcubacteria bacterium]
MTRKITKIVFALSILVGSAIATLAYAEMPQSILLQIKPGYNPDNIIYEREAEVFVNDKRVGGHFTITDDFSQYEEKMLKLHKLMQGDLLKVDATFTDPDGGDAVSCTRTWTAIAEDNIGCGPIEVNYHPYDNSCSLICN